MSSATRPLPASDPPEPAPEAPTHPAGERSAPSFEDVDTTEMPTRVHTLAPFEVRAIFAGVEAVEREVDVSGLELDDLPTRTAPVSSSPPPVRAVSLSDDGIVVPIEVFDPVPETGVRPRIAETRTTIVRPEPSWVDRVMRVLSRALRRE